jgi:hypothetical protein
MYLERLWTTLVTTKEPYQSFLLRLLPSRFRTIQQRCLKFAGRLDTPKALDLSAVLRISIRCNISLFGFWVCLETQEVGLRLTTLVLMQGFAADVEEARRARDPSTGPATLEAYLEVARSTVTTDLFVALICVLSAGVRVPASVPDSPQYIHIRVRIQTLPLVCMFRNSLRVEIAKAVSWVL